MTADELPWRVHTSNLLSEIAENSKQTIYRIPLGLLASEFGLACMAWDRPGKAVIKEAA